MSLNPGLVLRTQAGKDSTAEEMVLGKPHSPSQNPECDDKDEDSRHFDRKLSSEDADLQTLVNQQRKKNFTLVRLYKIHYHFS